MIQIDDHVRLDVLKQLLAERDDILLKRLALRQQINALELKDRELMRALLDRVAAARLFGHNVGFPVDPRDYESMEKLVAAMTLRRKGKPWVPGQTTPDPDFAIQPEGVPTENPTERPSEAPKLAAPERPRIRDIVLERLRAAGSGGTRASELRTFLESAHSIKTHEKTVGMTLYRLSQEGLARRDGRTWFFGPPVVETKNPGVGAPGLEDLLK